MKKVKLKSNTILFIIVTVFILGLQACAKSKVRRNIAGSWILKSVTYDGVDYVTNQGGTYSGTFVFNQITARENKKSEGRVSSSVTTTYSGSSDTQTDLAIYKIVDKGDKIFYDNDKYTLNLSSNSMVMTSLFQSEVCVMTFSR